MYDYGARNYDPVIGRFFNIDPMADERTWVSPFNYVQNNPISRVDPTGMLDGWIDYEENGQRNVEYRSDINTKAEAAGYKNVSKVIESGTLTASNGTVYNLSKSGGVSSDNVLGTINYNTTQDVITSGGSHIKGFLNGYDGPGAISSPSFSYFDRWDHQVAMGTLQGGSIMMMDHAVAKGIGYTMKGFYSLRQTAMNVDNFSLHARLTSLDHVKYNNLNQFDVGHRATAFISNDIIQTGTVGVKDFNSLFMLNKSTVYFNKTIGNQQFSIGVNPFNKTIFHQGPGYFK